MSGKTALLALRSSKLVNALRWLKGCIHCLAILDGVLTVIRDPVSYTVQHPQRGRRAVLSHAIILADFQLAVPDLLEHQRSYGVWEAKS